MKRIIPLLLLCIVMSLLVACSPNKEEGKSENKNGESLPAGTLDVAQMTGKSVEMNLKEGEEITLKNFTLDQGLSIEVESSSKGFSKGNAKKTAKTGLDTTLLIPNAEGKLVLDASDLGITKGKVKIINIGSDSQHMVITPEEIEAETRTTTKTQTGEPGKVMEELYTVNLNAGAYKDLDKSKIAITQYITGSKIGVGNYDYGFLNENGAVLDSNKSNHAIKGLVDLSDIHKIGLYNSFVYEKGVDVHSYIYIGNPKAMTLDGTQVAVTSNRNVYLVPKANDSKKYALKVTLSTSEVAYTDFSIQERNHANPRYIGAENNGRQRNKSLAPYYVDGVLYAYLGEINEEFIFDFNINTTKDGIELAKISIVEAPAEVLVPSVDMSSSVFGIIPFDDARKSALIFRNSDKESKLYVMVLDAAKDSHKAVDMTIVSVSDGTYGIGSSTMATSDSTAHTRSFSNFDKKMHGYFSLNAVDRGVTGGVFYCNGRLKS